MYPLPTVLTTRALILSACYQHDRHFSVCSATSYLPFQNDLSILSCHFLVFIFFLMFNSGILKVPNTSL